MGNRSENQLNAMLRNVKRRRWQSLLLLCLALLVTVGVAGIFHHTAIAKTYQVTKLTCTAVPPEGPAYADFFVHIHNDDCFDAAGNLVCPLPEIRPHRHTSDCYTTTRTLACTIPESDGHQHTADCYTRVRGDLICEKSTEPVLDEEGNTLEEGHIHTDECFAWTEELSCGLEAGQGAHHHDDSCFETNTTLICDQPEVLLHTHTDACYQKNEDGSLYVDEDGNTWLICGQLQVLEHVHGPECFTMYELDDGESEIVFMEEDAQPAENDNQEAEASDGAVTDDSNTDPADENTSDTVESGEAEEAENAEAVEHNDSEDGTQTDEGTDDADSADNTDNTADTGYTDETEPNADEEQQEAGTGEDTAIVEELYTVVYTGTRGAEKGGMTVLAEIPEGALDENAQLVLSDADESAARKQILKVVNENAAEGEEREISSMLLLNISFASGGEPAAPNGPDPIRITLRAAVIRGMNAPKLFHLSGGTAREVEDVLFDTEAGSMVFTSAAFSPFAVVDLTGEEQTEEITDETADETVSVLMPAQSFTGETDGVLVSVEAPEGAFPEGTTMVVSPVEMDDDTLSNVTGAVESSGEQKVVTAQAVDISFFDAGQNLIEPKLPIKVSMKSAIVSESENVALVHLTEAATAEPAENTAPEEPTAPTAPTAEVVTDVQVVENPDEDNEIQFESDAFSVYVLVGTETITTNYITADGETYTITVSYGHETGIPTNAELEVNEILPADGSGADMSSAYGMSYDEYVAYTENALGMKEGSAGYIRLFDIKIVDTDDHGVKYQPAEGTSVNVSIELADSMSEEMSVVHFANEDDSGAVVDASVDGQTVSFETDGFSVYAVVYTVDFHYEVNGRLYEFSLPGGGFVSLEHIVEVLGIHNPGTETAGMIDSSENSGDFLNETDEASESEVPNGDGTAAYEEAIHLNSVEVSEAAKKFVADVVSVEFSSPELVWVGKAEEATTVGALKNDNGLDVQYSAELTEEQIEEINSSTVEAGDWVLISVQPFLSDESLTVTMKNGDQWTLKVTDAQISTHVITADGEDFIITVTYGDDALIPEGAILEADEIVSGTEEYENYLAQAQKVLLSQYRQETEPASENDATDATGNSDTAEPSDESEPTDPIEGEGAEDIEETIAIDFARFFDIRIMAGAEKIEPAAPVKVTVTYADALDVDEEQSVCAVHFGEGGTEVINTSSDQNRKSVSFMQASFSVTGTIVTSGGTWPASGSSNVMYVQSGSSYYAVAHDGSLHQVTVSGNKITFPDDADTFDLNSYLWTYEEQYSWPARTTRFVYYLDDYGTDHYLAPNTSIGISVTTTNVSRDSNGKIYYYPGYGSSSYYIGIDHNNSAIIGNLNNSNDAAAVQFANNFVLPRKATIHFVDRNGNPLTGISYTGPSDYPVTANSDGTFTVPYVWDMENSEYTLHLDTNFSKTGYTYASTHLAGTRQGTYLTYNGLTIDAALKERNNTMYFSTDTGDTRAYGNLAEQDINAALRVPNEAGTGLTDYLAANVNKDIYVILDPVPTGAAAQQTEIEDIDDPEFSKTLESNEDGTYTLSLNVKGHGINAATNPKANVIFVVDTSSSMDKTDGTGTGYSRLHDTKPALKTLAQDLLLSNSMSGKDADTVEVAMVSFDGGVVNELGWTTNYSAFENAVDNGLKLHRGTDWEDALQRAYELGLAKQVAEPDQKVFVVFFTDGEASQYRSFHGQGTYNTTVNPNYGKWYSYFLSRESAKDEARAIVNANMQFYAIYAFNQDGSTYNGEAGSDLLRNLVRYAYNSVDLGNKNFFAKASNTSELEAAFNSILLSVREFLGFSDVVMNDDITSLTSTGINLVSSAVGGFTYTRSGGQYGDGTTWTGAPAATHSDPADGDVTSVKWDLGNTVLEEGVTYTVSFKVWPSQEAYDWLANLQNGTKTWDDVVAAGLDAPDGTNPQIVKNGDSYSLLTNKPSTNSDGEIINNKITYKKVHSETVTDDSIPSGTELGKPIEGTDGNGNKTITTYTLENGVYTKTVVTEKETYFKNPDPMPLVPESMNVRKEWATSMNTSHPADELKFRVLVDGQYYQNDGSLVAGDAGQTNAKVLPVSNTNSWVNSINIAPGIVKYHDDDGNALSEALVLETGHNYTLEEFDLMEGGSAFLYYTSYEFHSQTMRPMIVDGTLKYLVLIDPHNPAPAGTETYTIGTETYYTAASGSGNGTMSGTNYRTAELDVTKIIQDNSGANLTDAQLDAESFTYRITLSIPDGTDPAGIVGYEYVPRTTSNAYTLYGYQAGETAFASDIGRFSGKTFRAWNTLVYRDLVEWENIGGRIVSKTDTDGNIIWQVPNVGGYHSITYDMTLNRNEVIRFTNLPTGTTYRIQEIYANYYQADNSDDSAGHAPIAKASNIADEGYSITQVLTTNGTVTQTALANDTVSGTIDTPNVRYYNQFTNELRSVKTQITILKTNQDGTKPLPGAVFDLYDKAGYEAEPKVVLKTGLTSSDVAGKEGTIDLGKLSEGTYYLVETSAPAGYIPLSNPVTITVTEGNVTYNQENSLLDDNGSGKTGNFQIGYQLKVINDEGVVLPNTGGAGTAIFTVIGGIMTALAGVVLSLKKRKARA